MTKQMRADLVLISVTLCWGISFYLVDVCFSEMETFTQNSFRFLGAFLIAGIIAFPKLKSVNRTTLKYACFVGIALAVVYTGSTLGVKYTSLSNAGFLGALTAVFTPILAFFIKKEKPEKKLTAVICMCVVGIALMTLNNEFKPALGDIFALISAFAYAVDLLITEFAVAKEEVDAFQMGVFQLGFTGMFMLIAAFAFEEPCLPSSGRVWGSILFLTVFCTGLAFIAQTVAQKYTSASHVGVIFTLEPVFAGVAARIFGGEILLPRAYLGAVLMIAGVLIMETDIKNLIGKYVGKNKNKNESGNGQ